MHVAASHRLDTHILDSVQNLIRQILTEVFIQNCGTKCHRGVYRLRQEASFGRKALHHQPHHHTHLRLHHHQK